MEAVATAQEQPKKSLVEIFMEGTKKARKKASTLV